MCDVGAWGLGGVKMDSKDIAAGIEKGQTRDTGERGHVIVARHLRQGVVCVPTLLEIRRGGCLPRAHVKVLVEAREPELGGLGLAKRRRLDVAGGGG